MGRRCIKLVTVIQRSNTGSNLQRLQKGFDKLKEHIQHEKVKVG